MNCHGCKWLDEVKHNGEGYCCMIKRSKSYKPGAQIRKPNDERCELFKPGNFKTRYNETKE